MKIREARDNKMIGNRIIIIGCPGSGKSTFAKKLAAQTCLPLFHLDMIWWKADRTHVSRDVFDSRLADIISGDRWIIDGDYSRTYVARFRTCDTIVFFDLSEDDCLDGIRKRIGSERSDIPWKEDRPDGELIELIKNYRNEKRPEIYRLISEYPEKQVVIFHSRTEADGWLCQIEKAINQNSGAM